METVYSVHIDIDEKHDFTYIQRFKIEFCKRKVLLPLLLTGPRLIFESLLSALKDSCIFMLSYRTEVV